MHLQESGPALSRLARNAALDSVEYAVYSREKRVKVDIMANDKLSIEKLEEMFDAYVENPSAQHVASACGVHYNTARKYIKHGDPTRGMEPFEQRCTRITQLAARRVEKRITYARADANAAAWQHLQLLDDVIIEALLRYRETLVNGKPKLGDIVQAVKVSGELKTRLEKWSDDQQAKQGDGSSLPRVLTEMSVTELEVFAQTGVVPKNRAAIPPPPPPHSNTSEAGRSAPAPEKPGHSHILDPPQDEDELLDDEVLDASELTPRAVSAVVGAAAEVVDTVPQWLEPED